MKAGILASLLVFGAVIGLSAGEPGGLFGGDGGGLFGGGWGVPVEYGEKTESKLPPVFKEHHYHEYIKKPHFQVEHSKSEGHKHIKVIHNHHKHQKVVHKNHHHEHVLKDHHQHNVHLHNLHKETQHVHEHVLHREHIHKPIYIQHEQHQHKVTAEKQIKQTQSDTHAHVHTKTVHEKHAEPIHQKEWSIRGWFDAWNPWGK